MFMGSVNNNKTRKNKKTKMTVIEARGRMRKNQKTNNKQKVSIATENTSLRQSTATGWGLGPRTSWVKLGIVDWGEALQRPRLASLLYIVGGQF